MGDAPFPNPEAIVSLSLRSCSLKSPAIDELFQNYLLPEARTGYLANVVSVDARDIVQGQDTASVESTAKSLATSLSRYCPRLTNLQVGHNPWNDNARLFCFCRGLTHLDLSESGTMDVRGTLAAIGQKSRNMQSLCMSGNQAVSEEFSDALQEFLPGCVGLKQFEIGAPPNDGDPIEEVDIGTVMATLENPGKLEHLKLLCCHFGHGNSMSTFLRSCTHLQSLSLIRCVIRDGTQFAAVFESIVSSSGLRVIDISHCLGHCILGGVEETKDDGPHNKEEHTIWGSNNDPESPLTRAHTYFQFYVSPMLTDLCLSGMEMNDYVVFTLLDGFGVSPKLEKLDFSNNLDLTKYTAIFIAGLIDIGFFPALECVDFRGTSVSHDEAAQREILSQFPEDVTIQMVDAED